MAQPIDEGMFVRIGGVEQWITVRGTNIQNPVLFIVSGTGAALSRMALFFAPWEQDFTVAQWDQPGAGATAARNRHTATAPLTLDRIARDGIEAVETILRQLGAAKVILVAMSGGSIVGIKMAQQRPDLFRAYVGTGQFVNWSRQERLSYAMVLERARQRQDESAIAELEAIGAPPYADAATDAIRSKYAGALTDAEQRVFADLDPGVMSAARTPPADAHYVPQGLTLVDQRTQSMATYEALRNEIARWDAREEGLTFPIPMFFFQGEQDAYSVTSEVERYVADIDAPRKMLMLMRGGGHSSMFMREEFLALLKTHVRGFQSSRST
jgi:pimeloyl-ACP methyl ester carboxylesterase